jgi:WD40 repeat protein
LELRLPRGLGKPLKIQQLRKVEAISISPNDQMAASGLASGIMQDCDDGYEILRLDNHSEKLVLWVILSPDSWRLATGGPQTYI